jgi:hypothetical protein
VGRRTSRSFDVGRMLQTAACSASSPGCKP